MKKIIVRGPAGTVSIQIDEGLTNDQAAAKAAEALGIIGLFSWYPYPRADPEHKVSEGQVFEINRVPQIKPD